MNKKSTITIGSDPEFLIVDKNGHCVPADKVFIHCDDCDKCKKCGKQKCDGNKRECGICEECGDEDCDSETYEDCEACWDCEKCHEDPDYCDFCMDCMDMDDVDLDGEIGCDGCSEVGELRPRYENSPEEHHENIAALISQIDIPSKYELRAGTRIDGYDLGGHIHLGIGRCNQRYGESQTAASYMSRYAGIPLRKIEHKLDLQYRGLCEHGYGRFGAHSDRQYGIEWRMPASWLVNSDIALAALSLAHVVASEYLIEPKKITIPSIQSQTKTLESPTLPTRVIARIEKMNQYKKYSSELESLFQMLVNKEEWDTSTDIRDEWS